MGASLESHTWKVWFTLHPDAAEFSATLQGELAELMLAGSWKSFTSDEGRPTYTIECSEKTLEKLYKRFHNNEFIQVWGLITSGVVENGQFNGWPSFLRQPDPVPVQTLKKSIREIWNDLKKKWGPKAIK